MDATPQVYGLHAQSDACDDAYVDPNFSDLPELSATYEDAYVNECLSFQTSAQTDQPTTSQRHGRRTG